MTRKRPSATKRFEQDKAPRKERYLLHLYITGTSPRSLAALTAIDTLCRELEGRCSLEVTDVSEHSPLAMDEQITTSMLAWTLPPSLRRLVGNRSDTGTDTERMLLALDLPPAKA